MFLQIVRHRFNTFEEQHFYVFFVYSETVLTFKSVLVKPYWLETVPNFIIFLFLYYFLLYTVFIVFIYCWWRNKLTLSQLSSKSKHLELHPTSINTSQPIRSINSFRCRGILRYFEKVMWHSEGKEFACHGGEKSRKFK